MCSKGTNECGSLKKMCNFREKFFCGFNSGQEQLIANGGRFKQAFSERIRKKQK
jgi:hypothetical protein